MSTACGRIALFNLARSFLESQPEEHVELVLVRKNLSIKLGIRPPDCAVERDHARRVFPAIQNMLIGDSGVLVDIVDF